MGMTHERFKQLVSELERAFRAGDSEPDIDWYSDYVCFRIPIACFRGIDEPQFKKEVCATVELNAIHIHLEDPSKAGLTNERFWPIVNYLTPDAQQRVRPIALCWALEGGQ